MTWRVLCLAIMRSMRFCERPRLSRWVCVYSVVINLSLYLLLHLSSLLTYFDGFEEGLLFDYTVAKNDVSWDFFLRDSYTVVMYACV